MFFNYEIDKNRENSLNFEPYVFISVYSSVVDTYSLHKLATI